MDWRSNLVTSDEQVENLLHDTKRIAVLGIKPETHSGQPAYYVPRYMQNVGYEIIPVPVYYPEVTEILGKRVYRDLRNVPDKIDMVNVFRLPHDIPKHTDEILEARPDSVWFQSGIRNDEVAETFAKAGIQVVQDLCLMVEHRALLGQRRDR
jgi:predicted CoA-binding protein